jgi:RNA polymerase sigma factor (sigma-70 family)
VAAAPGGVQALLEAARTSRPLRDPFAPSRGPAPQRALAAAAAAWRRGRPRQAARLLGELPWRDGLLGPAAERLLEAPHGRRNGHAGWRRRLQQCYEAWLSCRNDILARNARLVVSTVARLATPRHMELDLIQEGHLGLMRAVELFDPRRGLKFSTYATFWIRQSVSRTVCDHSRVIRLPVYRWGEAARVRRMRAALEARCGEAASAEALAAMARASREHLEQLAAWTQPAASLDAPVGEQTELGELLAAEGDGAAEAALELDELRQAVGEILVDLTPQEQTVIRLRFGLDTDEPLTLAAIGRRLGLTRERIRQVESKALAKLRRPDARCRLAPFAPVAR